MTKHIITDNKKESINDWIIKTRNRTNEKYIGFMSAKGSDFQNTNYVFIINNKSQLPHPRGTWVTDKNLKEISVYFAVRKCISATWLNDRDQFLHPNNEWLKDKEFQNDCLAYTLFNNNIQSEFGTNYWIPFKEDEVNAKEKFDSNFMYEYIKGKHINEKLNFDTGENTISQEYHNQIIFSKEAQSVMDVGREIWHYYHSQPNVNTNASFYDIRLYFQGRNSKGKMNTESSDQHYNKLINSLRDKIKLLAEKIEPKVYEYGFLFK